MILTTKGNILESDAQAIVNTVNTVGVMGKGLALQFKETYPVNYHKYKDACKRGEVRIGAMFITEETDLHGRKIIVNFPTKTTWRKPSTYEYVEQGLNALKKEIVIRNISSIAIPPLGSRNGGLDWNIVKKMIYDKLSDLECDIYLYEPNEQILDRMRSERVKLTPARAMMLDVMYDMVSQGEIISEFAAEKDVYFLQRFGAEDVFKLQFKHAFYGPYSGKVRHVLRYLNGSYVMGLVEMNQKPFDPIWIIPEAKQDVLTYMALPENARYAEIVSRTKEFLRGFYSNFSLELLATVDYILKSDIELIEWKSMNLDAVIDKVLNDISRWSYRKQSLFGQEKYIRIVLEHLKNWSKISW